MTFDLFANPQLNADPDACPLGYHRYATEQDVVDIRTLRDAGLGPMIWAYHFVVNEKCRTVAQFCSFQPNEKWGANYVKLLVNRQKLLFARIQISKSPKDRL